MSHPTHQDEGAPQVPDELAGRLKQLGGPRVLVPPSTDKAILAQARRHLAGVGRARRVIALPRWLAAAALVALCAWLGQFWFSSRPPASVAREDINRDGRVDILDAFAVARRLQQGPVTGPEFDINRDGVVDRRDIDAIAAEAVKLAKGQG